jgi:Family of unknown function (DUF5706)
MNTFPDYVMPRVQQAHEQARDELRRADTKATTLLSVVGAALAGVVALTTRQQISPAAVAALWSAAVPIFAAVLVLLAAIRPRLGQFPTPGTWLDAVFNGPAALLEARSEAAATVLAADVVLLGGIAVAKYQRVGRSVSLLFVGLSVLAVALVLSVLT